jgi:hypothetical protein
MPAYCVPGRSAKSYPIFLIEGVEMMYSPARSGDPAKKAQWWRPSHSPSGRVILAWQGQKERSGPKTATTIRESLREAGEMIAPRYSPCPGRGQVRDSTLVSPASPASSLPLSSLWSESALMLFDRHRDGLRFKSARLSLSLHSGLVTKVSKPPARLIIKSTTKSRFPVPDMIISDPRSEMKR